MELIFSKAQEEDTIEFFSRLTYLKREGQREREIQADCTLRVNTGLSLVTLRSDLSQKSRIGHFKPVRHPRYYRFLYLGMI